MVASPLIQKRGEESEVVGVAVFADTLDEVEGNVALIRRQILLSGGIALVIALIAGYLVARALSQRVGRLEHAARKVAAGDFSNPIRADSDDELGQLAAAFDDMQNQLARLDRARKQFIASASHELRTPIFSLGGFLELLADEDLDEETRRQFLEQLRGQVDRMRKLATELLDLSRLEAGALELRPEPTDVGQLAREVAGEFTPAAQRHASAVRPGAARRADRARLRPGARRTGPSYPARQRARPHPRGHRSEGFSGPPERARSPRGVRPRPWDQATEHAPHLRTLLHLQRGGTGRRPRPGDRPRAGRAHAGAPHGALGARLDDVLAGDPRMRRLALLAALVALAGCGGGGDDDQPSSGGGDEPRSQTTRVEVIENSGEEGGFDPKAIYESEAPGVVTVISLFGSSGLDSVLDQGGEGGGVGSGFVLNGEGEIATNAHVVTTGEGDAIRRAREVYVSFADGNQVEADIVGADPNADIALLRIDPKGLKLRPLPLGESSSVEVGEPVAAIGSPFGEEQSLSIGVISAIDRSIQSLTNFSISGAFQTDAAINPGNSGGPLVDGEGRVIGVNQQIKSTSGGGEGVGFAVPVDAVKRSVEMLRKDGTADYAYLGVSSVELYPQLVEKFDLDVDKGAWVQEVNSGAPGREGRSPRRRQPGRVPGAVVPPRRRRDHQGRRQGGRGLRAARRPDRRLRARRGGPAGDPPGRRHARDQGEARGTAARQPRRVGFLRAPSSRAGRQEPRRLHPHRRPSARRGDPRAGRAAPRAVGSST